MFRIWYTYLGKSQYAMPFSTYQSAVNWIEGLTVDKNTRLRAVQQNTGGRWVTVTKF